MIEYFERNWWLWSLRGLIALIFGIMALTQPGLTLTAMVLLFTAFMFADGIFALLTLFAQRTDERWSWAVFFEGIAGVTAATVTCLLPNLSVLVLLSAVGGWALVSGVFKLATAFRCRKASCVPGSILLGLAGLGSLVLGFTFLFYPTVGFVAVSTMVGAYAIYLGWLMLMEGLRLKRFYRIFDVKKVHLQIRHPYYPA